MWENSILAASTGRGQRGQRDEGAGGKFFCTAASTMFLPASVRASCPSECWWRQRNGNNLVFIVGKNRVKDQWSGPTYHPKRFRAPAAQSAGFWSPSQPITMWWGLEQTQYYGPVKLSYHLRKFAVAFPKSTKNICKHLIGLSSGIQPSGCPG